MSGEISFTSREIAFLRLAAQGTPYQDIGRELGMSYQYAKNFASRLIAKMGADNMTQAVAMAIRRRIIE